MIAARRSFWATLACATAIAIPARAETTYEDADGVRWAVTKTTVQVAVPQPGTQQQTVLRQQITTQTLQQQQLYTVPVTQYQLVSTLHGRWNPFVIPYWTHEYQPVTTWQQQTANVQIPVNTVTWVPTTQTVPTQTMAYKTVENFTKVAIGPSPAGASQPMMASTGSSSAITGPTATLAARPSATTGGVPSVASAPPSPTYGGQMMTSDPPKQAQSWQSPSDARYGDSTRRY